MRGAASATIKRYTAAKLSAILMESTVKKILLMMGIVSILAWVSLSAHVSRGPGNTYHVDSHGAAWDTGWDLETDTFIPSPETFKIQKRMTCNAIHDK